MYKVCFVCQFSNSTIRDRLTLKKWKLRNWISKTLKHPLFIQRDFAIWVSDYIEEFKRFQSEYEFHIISPHIGMKGNLQEFNIDGIYYHFFRSDSHLIYDYLNAKFRINERTDFRSSRLAIHNCIEAVNPDIVVICGAENPIYSSAALDEDKRPVYLLLQTVLNNPQMVKYTQTARYRVEMEKRVFRKVKYFSADTKEYYDLFRIINTNAISLPIIWPNHQPCIIKDSPLKYDYIFFGRISKNKGVEDVIDAAAIIVRKYPSVRLCVIGDIESNYGRMLFQKAVVNGCGKNVTFMPAFSDINDVYAEVQKSRFVVVPGITAFNSTARESMLLGLPVIVYELPEVSKINSEKKCLLTANTGDVKDLAKTMLYVYEHPEEAKEVAANGKEYADMYYSNKRTGVQITSNFNSIISHYYNNTPIESVSL